LRFNDGKFQGFKSFDRNSIDAYQLKKYGITIKGQVIRDFNYEVNFDILIDEMRNNLNTYWINWINDCRKLTSMKYIGLFVSLNMIEWGVLGISRLYYTFKERDITSKIGAGEYALQNVPERWHKIINESM
ncbi:aminoglycoside adenylyltransferase domain-containing protein, partial [Clostridium perfringens]|uniref:aminoglycoside adenylyltransferase domain-containing protein n=2 Tax=Clostridium TaxID=1485 RepID=UPI002AC452D6